MPQILATKIEGQLARSDILEYYRIDSFDERRNFPLNAQDRKMNGLPLHRVDLLVAPVIRFDPENPDKLNEFMMNLTDAKPYSVENFRSQAVTGTNTSKDLLLGRLTFKEVIGQLKTTTTTEIQTDQPQVFAEAGISLTDESTKTIDYLRYIVLRPYPDVRAIRLLAEIEKDLASGIDVPVDYEFIWLLNKIRAPHITSMKRGKNPFTRSRFVMADKKST